MLDIQNLSGGYGDMTIAQQINLAVQSGEWLSLMGAN